MPSIRPLLLPPRHAEAKNSYYKDNITALSLWPLPQDPPQSHQSHSNSVTVDMGGVFEVSTRTWRDVHQNVTVATSETSDDFT